MTEVYCQPANSPQLDRSSPTQQIDAATVSATRSATKLP
jgi:hypothetical protein